MESVNYDEIVRWLGNSRKTIPTLGRRKTLTFWVENGIITGEDTHGNRNTYSREYWREISQVIDATEPERREITTNYNHCPSYFKSPGVPALCRAYCEDNID